MKVGVIGAGTMGQGIAKAFAQVEGYTVALCDIKQEWADNGKATIAAGCAKLVAKGELDQAEADRRMATITAGLKEDLCADCDLIVEAAFEDMKVKQTTFGELDKICKPECIFASNTSSLSITEIGKGAEPSAGRHALLQPRRPHEADRGHRRCEHSRRDRGDHQEDQHRDRQDARSRSTRLPASSSTAS